MKKVLIILYYWPPTGGSGVQRWVKFVKHLRSFGWEPVIYTPLNPFVSEIDESLLKDIPESVEVLKQPVFEVAKYFGAPAVNKGTGSPSLIGKLKSGVGNYIRGTFFVPDPRITWVEPSVKFLSSYLQDNKIDAIVSSGPPHSLHLIALKLKEKFGLPWLADFRDPWLEILNFHGFTVSENIIAKHRNYFLQVIGRADSVLVAHESVRESFQRQTQTPVKLITNGYDIEDIKKAAPISLPKNKFKIVFVGILYNKLNSAAFWKALAECINEDEQFKAGVQLVLVGKIGASAMADIEGNDLKEYCRFIGYVDHLKAVSYQKSADVLLLFTPGEEEFKYVIPGKLFEYLAIQKPILCIGRGDNDSAQIIIRQNAGIVVDSNSVAEIKEALRSAFSAFKESSLFADTRSADKYERKNLTKELASELNRITR